MRESTRSVAREPESCSARGEARREAVRAHEDECWSSPSTCGLWKADRPGSTRHSSTERGCGASRDHAVRGARRRPRVDEQAPSRCAASAVGSSRSSSLRLAQEIVERRSRYLSHVVAAILARAAQDDVVRGDRRTRARPRHARSPTRARVLERLDLPAVVAHEVVVVVASGVSGLEARDPVAEVDPLDEPELVHAVERAVDARDPDPPAACAQRVVDLLRGEAAVLLAEELDDEPSRTAAPAARLAQPRRASSRSSVMSIMIPVLKDVLPSRHARTRRLRCSCSAVVALAGCGGSDERRERADGRRRASIRSPGRPSSVAAPGTRVVNLTPAGRRAARPRAVAARPRDDPRRRPRPLPRAGFQPAVEDAVAAAGPSLDLLAATLRPGGEGGPGSARLARPGALRADRRAASGARSRRRARPLDARAQSSRARPGVRGRARECRTHEIVTSHAAFGHLAKRYGLEQLSLAGLSPEAEPSPRDLEALVDEVRRSGAPRRVRRDRSSRRGSRRPSRERPDVDDRRPRSARRVSREERARRGRGLRLASCARTSPRCAKALGCR